MILIWTLLIWGLVIFSVVAHMTFQYNILYSTFFTYSRKEKAKNMRSSLWTLFDNLFVAASFNLSYATCMLWWLCWIWVESPICICLKYDWEMFCHPESLYTDKSSSHKKYKVLKFLDDFFFVPAKWTFSFIWFSCAVFGKFK